MVVMAMSKYLEKSGTAAPRMTLSLEFNDKVIWTREVTPENWATFEGRTVLTDVNLPDLDGVSLTRALLALPPAKQTQQFLKVADLVLSCN